MTLLYNELSAESKIQTSGPFIKDNAHADDILIITIVYDHSMLTREQPGRSRSVSLK